LLLFLYGFLTLFLLLHRQFYLFYSLSNIL
jgi:hypothetical protein